MAVNKCITIWTHYSMGMFYVNQLFFLYHRSAWHLIQPKEYPPTVPCLTHTSTTWRDARRTWIPICHQARTARRWTQPEVPAAALSWPPRESYWWLMGPHEEALQSCWGSQAGDLLAAVFWMGSASPRKPPSLLFEINARAIAAFCSFICLSVCLFQEPGKIPEEEKLLSNCAAISFF